MSKLFYYIWIGIWVAIGLPIVGLIMLGIYLQNKLTNSCTICQKK